jgi:hypothetical protein
MDMSIWRAALEAAQKVYRCRKGNKVKAQRCYLRTLLSSLRPHQQMTAEQVFGSFGWQIDGRLLFNSEAAVTEVLRSMRNEGVRFDVASKGWHVTRDVNVAERLRSAMVR